MYKPEAGHFCSNSIASWDKYVPITLKTHKENQCQKTHFAIK